MSKLASLNKARASRVLGIDASTHSLAFCVFYNRRPERWGKINFKGADVFDRIVDASNKTRAYMPELNDIDYVAMEGAILANNRNVDVTIKLSLMYGAILSELLRGKAKVVQVKPTEWQSFIGNKNFTKAEKDQLKVDFPNMSASWYTTKVREIRKQRTMDFINGKWQHMNITDNDVGDACGIAYHAYHKLTTRI